MSDKQPREELQRAALHAVNAVQLAIEQHPIASVAAGAGVGYILAAGIPSWLVRAGGAVALRAVAREVTSVALDTLAQNEAKSTPATAREAGASSHAEPEVEPPHAPAE